MGNRICPMCGNKVDDYGYCKKCNERVLMSKEIEEHYRKLHNYYDNINKKKEEQNE